MAFWLKMDGGKAVTDSFGMIMSGMSAIFSQISSIVQSNMEMETAAIEKRYDKEISLAEGNTYKVKKLEQDKENEIARAKNEANRKMFAMQVIQAVAQTAQNALAAYGSAAAIPIVGYIMAPIAAAMAVAAGAVQIAGYKETATGLRSAGVCRRRIHPPRPGGRAGRYRPCRRVGRQSETGDFAGNASYHRCPRICAANQHDRLYPSSVCSPRAD